MQQFKKLKIVYLVVRERKWRKREKKIRNKKDADKHEKKYKSEGHICISCSVEKRGAFVCLMVT